MHHQQCELVVLTQSNLVLEKSMPRDVMIQGFRSIGLSVVPCIVLQTSMFTMGPQVDDTDSFLCVCTSGLAL